MVEITFEGAKYIIDYGVWTGVNADMVQRLNYCTEAYRKTDSIGPEHGDPDYVIAEYIVEGIDAKITKYVDDEEYPEGVLF